jgi:hypothetical protein
VRLSLHLTEAAHSGAFPMPYIMVMSPSWEQRRGDGLHGALLTGWAGYLGSHLVSYRHIAGKLELCKKHHTLANLEEPYATSDAR